MGLSRNNHPSIPYSKKISFQMLGIIVNPHRNKGMCQEHRNSPDSPICFPDHMIPDDQGYNNIDFKALLKLA